MPRVALLPIHQINNAVAAEAKKYKGWLAENDISYCRVAELTGVTTRAIQKQFEKCRLTPETAKAIELMMEGKLK